MHFFFFSLDLTMYQIQRWNNVQAIQPPPPKKNNCDLLTSEFKGVLHLIKYTDTFQSVTH